jgi:hypothetical protein
VSPYVDGICLPSRVWKAQHTVIKCLLVDQFLPNDCCQPPTKPQVERNRPCFANCRMIGGEGRRKQVASRHLNVMRPVYRSQPKSRALLVLE